MRPGATLAVILALSLAGAASRRSAPPPPPVSLASPPDFVARTGDLPGTYERVPGCLTRLAVVALPGASAGVDPSRLDPEPGPARVSRHSWAGRAMPSEAARVLAVAGRAVGLAARAVGLPPPLPEHSLSVFGALACEGALPEAVDPGLVP